MKTRDTLVLALTALWRNKMRSLLTMLGVVIGVAAVIMMQALGMGATDLVTGEISSMGSNLLIVSPGGGKNHAFGGSMLNAPLFEENDLQAIREECDAVRYIAAVNSRSVNVVFGDQSRSVSLQGVTPAWYDIRDWPVDHGRALDEEDEQQGSKRCLIGETVRRELFGEQEPLGAEIRVHDQGCEIVGVLEGRGTSTFGTDQDDLVLMPFRTFSRRITGSESIGTMMVTATSEDRITEAKEQIEALLRQRRRILEGEDDDFSVRDLREIQELMGTVTGVLTTLLASVAAISLLVGGIGIMNIMLVSVTERTREIGIRLAIGARAGDILQQFLLEAITLAACGGLLGIMIGLGGAYGLAHAFGMPMHIPVMGTIVAFGFAVGVGVLFGVFPARKAARLRPIEALRFE